MKTLIESFCKICGAELDYSDLFRRVCSKCFLSIPRIDLEKACYKCGFPNGRDFCLFCSTNKLEVDRNISLYEYKGFVKELIYEIKFFKNSSRIDIVKELISKVDVDKLFGDKIDLLVPVPTSLKSLVERGFDFVYSVFKTLANENQKYFVKVIGKRIFSKSQKTLSREDRIKLSRNQFFIKKKIKLDGKIVLLVDDVFTTGNTINVCSSLIRELGAMKIYSLTLVRALEEV